MQVGDLVTLSAAGKKNKGNDLVVGKVGVIIEISEPSQMKYPINVRWFNALGLTPNSRYTQSETIRDKKSLRKNLTNIQNVIHYHCQQHRRTQ